MDEPQTAPCSYWRAGFKQLIRGAFGLKSDRLCS
jgi:hypothetical protein